VVKRKGSGDKVSGKRFSQEKKLRRDFYRFQMKVDKLNELRHELNTLDTKGFENETTVIRSMLKDTSAIPKIEKMIKQLRVKIMKRRKVRKKSPLRKIAKSVKEVSEDVESIENSNVQLKKEIGELKNRLDETLNKRGAVNSEVGLVVDRQFQSFIKGVKVDLSEKVKNKEKQLNDRLRKELTLRKKEIESRYQDMQKKLMASYADKEQRLKKRYDEKIEKGLQKEIDERFAEELRKKFNSERAKVDAQYVSQVKKKYFNSFLKQKRLLEAKLQNLTKKKVAEVLREKKKFRKRFVEEYHKKLVAELNNYKTQINAELKKKFDEKMKKFVDEQRAKKDSEIKEKLREMNNVLIDERKANNILKQNLSDKNYQLEVQKQKISQLIETQRQKNAALVSQLTKVKNQEAVRKHEEHRKLLEQHRIDVQNLTFKLKQEFNREFEKRLLSSINQEKKRINKELLLQKKKLRNVSFMKRREIKAKLKQENQNKLKKVIESNRRKLLAQLRKQFASQANQRILLERKKLENKLAELELKYQNREAELKLKEKKLLESGKRRNLELAAEKRKLADKLALFRKEEDLRLKNERVKIQKEIVKKMHDRLIAEINRREAVIKANLKLKFDEKLKQHERLQEQQLAQKKAELAAELQKKAAALMV